MRLKGYVAIDNEPLYDKVVLPTSLSANDYLFFTVPIGQKDPNGTTAKTYVDTNVDGNGGRLPDPKAFEIKAFALVFDFGTAAAAADIALVLNNSYFEIRVGGNTAVAHRCPAKVITQGAGLNRTDASANVNGVPAPSAIQVLSETIVIDKGQSFSAALVVKTSQTLSQATNLHCVFYGWHAKGVGKQ